MLQGPDLVCQQRELNKLLSQVQDRRRLLRPMLYNRLALCYTQTERETVAYNQPGVQTRVGKPLAHTVILRVLINMLYDLQG